MVGGAPEIPGASVRERRERAQASDEVDAVRRLLCHEPRGHADMYGCFLVPSDDAGADLGALFWHKDGFSTACRTRHARARSLGRGVGPNGADPDGDTDVTIDVPSGRVLARVACSSGRARRGHVPKRSVLRARAWHSRNGQRPRGHGRRGVRRRDLRLGAGGVARARGHWRKAAGSDRRGGAIKMALEEASSRGTRATTGSRAFTGRSCTRRPAGSGRAERPASRPRCRAPAQRRRIRRRRGRPLALRVRNLRPRRACFTRRVGLRSATRSCTSRSSAPSSRLGSLTSSKRRAPGADHRGHRRRLQDRASTASFSTPETHSGPASSCDEESALPERGRARDRCCRSPRGRRARSRAAHGTRPGRRSAAKLGCHRGG